MTPALSIATLTDRQLTRHVNDGFKQYHSVLLLSRSPLADSDLVTPTLVRDEVSPTADDRGNGLRMVLRWAVEQLAPREIEHPLGTFRPYDDPTWLEPAWWRYNILRHRYIEPLHPDDFVDSGRYTETLMALTGISSKDAYFDERNRAIGEVAQWLRRQFTHGDATATLRQIALESHFRPLTSRPEAADLLGIAATFTDVFPRTLLLQLARTESLVEPGTALDYLVGERYLLMGDDGESLWLSPVLRRYVYQRQDQRRTRARHRRAAAHFVAEPDPPAAIYHLQRSRQDEDAAALVLEAAPDLMAELATDELEEAILRFDRERLTAGTWCELQIILSDLYLGASRQDDALASCRQALSAAPDDLSRGRIYRRMGKLYEQRNQLHALNYYAQAAGYLPESHPECVEMLKDRAWIYIEQSDWEEALRDLQRSLALAAEQTTETRARIHDAFASLCRNQGRYDVALDHARQALILREEAGNPFDIAKSINNLGILYAAMGHYDEAVTAHREASAAFEQIGNHEHRSAALLNAGTACHFGGQLDEAVDYYRQSLKLNEQSEWPLTESRAHSNLVEALAEQGELALARDHWRKGMVLSTETGLADEVAFYQQLAEQIPGLAASPNRDFQPAPSTHQHIGSAQEAWDLLDHEEQQALSLAAASGRVTAADLMVEAEVSKATATRKLAALVERGRLVRRGKGRGTYYAPAADPMADGPDRVEGFDDAHDLSTVRRLLLNQRSLLAERYAVSGMATLHYTQSVNNQGPTPLAVRHRILPDLLTFLEMERVLIESMGFEVKLTPVEALAGQGAGGSEVELDWIWESK